MTVSPNDYSLQAFDIADDPQPSAESRHDLLRDVRSIRDTYANERARTENQLVAAQQTVAALAAQLRMADQKLVTIEDLIGEVRVRMHTRGLATHPVVRRPPPKSIPPVTLSNCASPNANDYAVNTQSGTFYSYHLGPNAHSHVTLQPHRLVVWSIRGWN